MAKTSSGSGRAPAGSVLHAYRRGFPCAPRPSRQGAVGPDPPWHAGRHDAGPRAAAASSRPGVAGRARHRRPRRDLRLRVPGAVRPRAVQGRRTTCACSRTRGWSREETRGKWSFYAVDRRAPGRGARRLGAASPGSTRRAEGAGPRRRTKPGERAGGAGPRQIMRRIQVSELGTSAGLNLARRLPLLQQAEARLLAAAAAALVGDLAAVLGPHGRRDPAFGVWSPRRTGRPARASCSRGRCRSSRRSTVGSSQWGVIQRGSFRRSDPERARRVVATASRSSS